MKDTTNHAASIRQRLLDQAKREGRPFSELVQYYAMERFLFRLANSRHSGCFVLKAKAIQLTFQQRGMDIPVEFESFREEFATMKQPMWAAFRRRIPGLPAPERFWELISDLTTFVIPVLGFVRDEPFLDMSWTPPGPWREIS